MGLLILRLTLGITTLFQGVMFLSEPGNPTLWMWINGLLAVMSGILLLVGFLAPVISAIVLTGSIIFIFSDAAAQPNSVIAEIYVTVIAAVIVLLGPGAFSFDARLFGRREIIIPKEPSAPNI